MEQLERRAILASLITEMESRASWSGETHLQKCAFFLQHMCEVPLDFKFILYLYGPFSFDLRDEITGMRADRFLKIVVRPGPYGPSLRPDEMAKVLIDQRDRIVRQYNQEIEFVAEHLSNKNVADLERLATTLYVLNAEGTPLADAAHRVTELKPHVSQSDAESAVREIQELKMLIPA